MCIRDRYEWADKNKTTPKTSAPSIETAMNVMRPYIDEGKMCIRDRSYQVTEMFINNRQMLLDRLLTD